AVPPVPQQAQLAIAAPVRDAGAFEAPAKLVESEGQLVEIPRSSDGLFYIDGKVNGATVHFLIDTGASAVVLTPEDAARAGVAADPGSYDAQLETAGGNAAMAWSRARRITVASRDVRGLDVAVPASGLKVSLLGQNMLAKLGPITLDGDRMVIHA